MTSTATVLGLATKKLTVVWASRYGALQRCLLREAAQVGGQQPLLPQSPRAALGTVIHSLFESAASDVSFPTVESEIAKLWSNAISNLETHLSKSIYMSQMLPLTRSIPNIGLMRSRTLVRLVEIREELVKIHTAQGRRKSGRLSNESGTVVGIPDKIAYGAGGSAIIDYKTGVTTDPQNPFRSDYDFQLKLYASLFHASNGEWPIRLELHGLDGSVHQTSFSADECTTLLDSAEKLAMAIGERSEQLGQGSAAQEEGAIPSRNTCRYCPFRPGCPAYVSAAQKQGPAFEGDVFGVLHGWRQFGNGEYLIELKQPSAVVRVRNLPPTEQMSILNFTKADQRIMLFNLVQDEVENPLFSPTAFTALHVYAEDSK